MTQVMRVLGVTVAMGVLAACTSSLDKAAQTSPQGDAFHNALYDGYLAYATREDAEFDGDAADQYAAKAVQAAGGETPAIADVSASGIAAEEAATISDAQGRLNAAMGKGAAGEAPKEAAAAQVALECWIHEQAEGDREAAEIARCRGEFEAAMNQIDAMMAPPMPEMIKISSDVLFAFDSAELKSDFTPALDEIAELLVANTNTPLLVWGFTDSVGTEEYNQDLSNRRAASVAAYMESQGVPASRMTVQGFGESKPVASNDTPEGRAENRRVEIRSR